jgi:hypothetical protein
MLSRRLATINLLMIISNANEIAGGIELVAIVFKRRLDYDPRFRTLERHLSALFLANSLVQEDLRLRIVADM